MTSSVSGLASGLDTSSLITQLMQLESQGQTRLKNQKSSEQSAVSTYQALNSKIAAVGSAADALTRATGWSAMKATSSDTDLVAVSAGSSALAGSLEFKVDRLATAAAIRSTGTVSSTTSPVFSGQNILVSAAGGLGFQSMKAGSGLATGTSTLTVTQASGGAQVAGTIETAGGVTLSGATSLDVEIDGAASTVNLNAGTYSTIDAFAAEVERASSGKLTAQAGADGKLRLSTVAEGSAHNLKLTGGTNLTELGLTAGAAASNGVDGKVKVGDVETVVTDVRAGAAVSLAASAGTIDATLGKGLRLGTAKASNVNAGDGSLASVASAINTAKAGVTATVVQVGDNAYRLQIGSTTTGTKGASTIDAGQFTGLGGFTTLSEGRDAQITVGSGAGAYTVNSPTNSVTGLMPGVTLTLKKQSADPVTVGVEADSGGIADKVEKMVKAVNDAIDYIKDNSEYDKDAKSGGPLTGDGLAARLQQRLRSAISGAIPASSLGSAGKAGMTLQSDGSIKFDREKFLTAYASDPDAVASLFKMNGTTASATSGVKFISANDGTREGSYAVNVTRAASQASSTGAAVAGGTMPGDETIEFKIGTATASYAARSGETLASVVAGINNATSAAGLGLTASVDNGKLVVKTNGYGAGSTFQLRSSATGSGLTSTTGTWEDPQVAGLDVEGTINGVKATGTGQLLTAPTDDKTLNGLTLRITSDSPTTDTFNYAPGLAQRLDSLVNEATNAVTGSITTAVTGRKKTMTRLDTQIADWDTRLALRKKTLQAQFTAMETALSKSKNQGNWLAGQISSLG
jgi:flagellar hook-associated protein 2